MKRENERELLAMGILALALFLFLSLLPASLLGDRGLAWFPTGNAMGVVGEAVRRSLWTFLGVTSFLVPFQLMVLALALGGWLERSWCVRLGVLGLGWLLTVPPALPLAGISPGWGGWLGERLARPLSAAFGNFGALFVLLVAVVLLLVGTVGWNPLRWLGRGGWKTTAMVLGAARWVWGWVGTWREARTRRAVPADPEEGKGRGAPEALTPLSSARSGDVAGVGGGAGEGVAGDGSQGRTAKPAHEGPDVLELWGGSDEVHPHPQVFGELPPLELLDPPDGVQREGMERELDRLGEILVEKLKTFNVECTIAGRTTGPVVTQFEVVPAPGVKVNRIANLDADLALAMKARSIRIVAPIPGKGAVGVEIPNPRPQRVLLREILESAEFSRSRAELPLALGKDLTGHPFVADLARMPHALIAGATGSGKSVCLNTFITSLVYRHTPETLRFLLIDPKMVELSAYVDLPHLRHPVVTDPRDAAGVLKWTVYEMERRYELLHVNGLRSLAEFNARLKKGVPLRRPHPKGAEGDPDRWLWREGPLPYLVLVIDELADLMMTVQSEVERPLTLLAQKARAIGIHLVVATQRPSVNVITGLIKANFPTRIAFRVASKVDSRTILDQNGADALLGNGDMLFLPPGMAEPIRIQGAYISTEETERLVRWYREQAEKAGGRRTGIPGADEEEDILQVVQAMEGESEGQTAHDHGGPERDELFWEAAEICIQHNQGSTSLLQRRMKIGYGRAARIVDQLHEAGILGPPDGSKAREVLVTLADLEFLRRGEEEGRGP